MQRIRFLCNIAILALIPMALYYGYDSLSWALNEALLKPERWLTDGWVNPEAKIAPLTRWIFLIFWIVPTVFGLLSIYFAMRLALLVRCGVLFDLRVARWVVLVGVNVAASGAAKIIAACVSPMIKSWHNPDGRLPFRFWFGSEEFGLIFCGLGFVLMGLVLREAIRLARENEAFV